MSKVRKGQAVWRGTVFVLAVDMKTAERWAVAVGLSKDKYRYVVNASVFDVMGENDTYAVVAGLEADMRRYTELMGHVRNRNLPWCGRDSYALTRHADPHPPTDDGTLPAAWLVPPKAGERGCCPDCEGTGVNGDPTTSGRCWDCRGSGHPHTGACPPVAVEVNLP